MKHLFTFLLLLSMSASLQAQIVFNGSPGGGSPPSTLGTYTLTSIPENRGIFPPINSVNTPGGGSIVISPNVNVVQSISGLWKTGYSGKVYGTTALVQTVTLTMPANTKAFYVYVQSASLFNSTITATAQPGNVVGQVTTSSTSGAKFIGFYVNQPNATIQTITLTNSNSLSGFAFGQLGIAQCAPITPTLTASNNGLLTCTNTTLTLEAGGGSSYSFSGPGLSQSGTGTTASVSQKGTYTVAVSREAGCPAVSKDITIDQNIDKPTDVGLDKDGLLTCVKTSVQLTAKTTSTQAVTYDFSGAGLSNVSGNTASASQPVEYSVKVTRTDNGCSASASTTVQQNIAPPTGVQLTNNGPLSVNKPTVTLSASSDPTGGVSFAFSAGTIPQGSNQATVTTSGAYNVTATRADNGCSAQATTTVLGAASPTVCRGGTATINLTAAGSPTRYEWYLNAPLGSVLRDGAFYAGATTPNLTINNIQQTGIYYAKAYYADGSSATYGPFRVTVNLNCNGRMGVIAEAGTELRITLLGNPLQGDALRALVDGAAGQRLYVELLDLAGRPVRSQVFESADSGQAVEWNLSGSASGVYVLQALSGGQRQSAKLVKP